MIQIRSASIKDLDSIVELAKVPELKAPHGSYPSLKWLQAIIKEKQIMLVAEDNNELIGFVMGEKIGSSFSILHLIAVKKEYRKKGIGNMLVNSFEEECKKRKLRGVLTYAHNDNKVKNFFKNRKYNIGQKVIECNKIF